VAVVTCGMIVNYFGRGMINDEKLMESYLVLAEYLLNTLLFTLGGVIWASISFEDTLSYQIQWIDWGWLIVLYILVLAIRCFQVAMFYPIFSRIGLKSNWSEAAFLAYGGLRGAVGVALGLSLCRYVFEKTDDPEKRKMAAVLQFLGGGVTLLSLTINGATAGPILKKLGLAKPPQKSSDVKILFEGKAKDFIYENIAELYDEPRFKNVSFAVLKDCVPFVTKEPPRVSANAEESQSIPTSGVLASHSARAFNRRTAGDGASYLKVVDLTKHASSAAEDGLFSESEMLMEMRRVFLELLGEAYKFQLEIGELDEKEDSGVLYAMLRDSVELAINEVEHSQGAIHDWKWTEKFRLFPSSNSSSFSLREEPKAGQDPVSSLNSQISAAKSEHSSFVAAARNRFRARCIRLDVLSAIAFQQGHKMAEVKLRFYFNRIDDEDDDGTNHGTTRRIKPILDQVLEESQTQVSKAQEMLDKEVGRRDLEVILSHYCARILIRRLMKFTEQNAEDGLLGKIEARNYLIDMDQRVRNVMAKTLEQLLSPECDDQHLEQVLDSVLEEGNNNENGDKTHLHPQDLQIENC